MVLTKVDISWGKHPAQQAEQLYWKAFPKEERLPWWVLRLNARRSGIDLTAWMDGGKFCGFTASVTAGKLHFLLFFAVAEDCRGQGYGSAILRQLRAEFEEVVLNVELLDPQADNFEQRQRRFAFYQRNGFHDTFHHVWEVGGKFRVLGTNPDLDVGAYKKIFKKLTLGLWNVKVLPAKR